MDGQTPPAIPVWVKLLGGIVLVAVLAAIVLHFTGRMAMHH